MTLTRGFRDSAISSIITPGSVLGTRMRAFQTAVAPASAVWPNANRAYLIPFSITVPTQIVEMFFLAGTSPGTTNYDLGIYRDDFTRIVNLGATAAVNTTDALLPVGGGDITDTTLAPGRYYMAMSSAATTLTTRAWTTYANGFQRALGIFMMESAQPLPTTVTPISSGTTAYIPMMGLATITNILS